MSDLQAAAASRFDGETFEQDQDGGRLTAQLYAVRSLMADGQWRTLAAIEERLGYPQASISARLRDLRKDRFGGLLVERRRVDKGSRGLHEYRVCFPDAAGQMGLGF